MNTFENKREATIQFSDVFGELPAMDGNALPDFDAVLTAQVRNTNHWQDLHFPTGAWPELGDYGAVLLDQLRQEQLDNAQAAPRLTDGSLHPDVSALMTSLEGTLVGVVNCAPRRADHHEKGVNGDEFHVGITTSGVEIYAQLPFFRGLKARGRLTKLYRIPNESGLWTPGEQFRSSKVSQARTRVDLLEPVSLDIIPGLEREGRVAYADKFGNVRLEIADGKAVAGALKVGTKVELDLGDGVRVQDVHVVSRLTDIPEGELGIYNNPADPLASNGPHYVEFVRRVSNPNTNRTHAYATLMGALKAAKPKETFSPSVWESVNIRIV